ncbi:MAG: hypothetical protein WCY80_02385 [Candidatus Izemoplasmatales bacterium]|jgi:hypothetical protein
MKKIIIIPLVLVIAFLIAATFIKVDTENVYPEGKNYFDPANVYKDDGYISTKNKFIVKPQTRYTFSISEEHWKLAPLEITVHYYDGDQSIYPINRYVDSGNSNMLYDSASKRYYFSFLTTPKTDLISIHFTDNIDYQNGQKVSGIQLEEGSKLTEFEAYVGTSFFETEIFYAILITVLTAGLIGGIVWHLASKNPKRLMTKKK